jgi:two-component system capsular synthesis response regulator RcsB
MIACSLRKKPAIFCSQQLDAIEAISKNKRYVPLEFQQAVRNKNTFDFTEYDILILAQLVQGTLQKNILTT